MIIPISAQQSRIDSRKLHERLDSMSRGVNDDINLQYLTPRPSRLQPKPRVVVDAHLHVNALQEIEQVQSKLSVIRGNTQASLTQHQLTQLGD